MSSKRPNYRIPTAAELAGRRILLVDDDDAIRRFMQTALGRTYIYAEAADGAQALAVAHDVQPDLVICDVEMPNMTGIEFCRVFKSLERFAMTPVIMMTAREGTSLKVASLDLGADDYLVKPVDPLELGARVRSMLRLKVLQDGLVAANAHLQDLNEKLKEISITDALTGIYNRGSFDKRLAYEFERARRYKTPLACVLIDVDHFKKVNDSYGHPVGDLLLRELAQLLSSGLRTVDVLARYGGEELAALLPQTTLEDAVLAAERLRRSVEKASFSNGEVTVHCTVSIGVAGFPRPQVNTPEDLVRSTDEALYRAKQKGRNRVVSAT